MINQTTFRKKVSRRKLWLKTFFYKNTFLINHELYFEIGYQIQIFFVNQSKLKVEIEFDKHCFTFKVHMNL